MRTDMVVVPTPGFDDDARFLAAPEPLERQALVAELAVEALVSAVLPGFAGVVQCRVDLGFAEPFKDRVADELRPVVRTKEAWRTVLRDQARQHLDHPGGADGAGDIDRQALAGELIDDRQTLDLLAARAGVEYKVVGPDVVGTECRQRTWP